MVGWLQAPREADLELRIAVACLAGGFWGLVMAAVLILPMNREVTLGPGTLLIRSWWQALTGRHGDNEWAEPKEAVWLWRRRSGMCVLQPRGLRLGPQSSDLAAAFRRLGFNVEDEQTDFRSANPGRWRAGSALQILGLLSMCVALLADLATGDVATMLGLGVAGLILIVCAGLVLYGPDEWYRA